MNKKMSRDASPPHLTGTQFIRHFEFRDGSGFTFWGILFGESLFLSRGGRVSLKNFQFNVISSGNHIFTLSCSSSRTDAFADGLGGVRFLFRLF